jgi:hypothetical protein
MVISASLQASGVGFPFAIPTSICRSNVTICSALYLLIAISSRPPREFSLTSAGTKKPGQVMEPGEDPQQESISLHSHGQVPALLLDRSLRVADQK